jgi:hypothetical protein
MRRANPIADAWGPRGGPRSATPAARRGAPLRARRPVDCTTTINQGSQFYVSPGGQFRMSLDRLLKNLVHPIDRIKETNAGFRSLSESIDTTTPAGRMIMRMARSFAEFERVVIRERTSAGLALGRAEGRVGGRRSGAYIRALRASVMSLYEVSEVNSGRLFSHPRPHSGRRAGPDE